MDRSHFDGRRIPGMNDEKLRGAVFSQLKPCASRL
jgi:hypothetical protein